MNTVEPGASLTERLRSVPILAPLDEVGLHGLDGARELHLNDEEILLKQGEMVRKFWILLSGSMRVTQITSEGHDLYFHEMQAGTTFGEVLLLASIPSAVTYRSIGPSEVLELNEDQFWALMTSSPEVRHNILGDMAVRLQKMQSTTFQQEKMASLGMMAAGLMHEINNPGAAARRAASQLRENLMRLHTLSAKFSRTTMSMDQKQCLFELQEHALAVRERIAMSSLEQSDAEEVLAEWMESAHVQDAWKMAPSLVAVGIQSGDLECARHAFEGEVFSDALGWLEALVSSQQLVGTIEESIGRVSELVMAVKSYAYEGRGMKQALNVNKSIHATLLILGHKLREKEIVLEKEFAPDLPLLQTDCQGLNQVWTNLIDNAIDASEQHGHLQIRTWTEQVKTGPGEMRTEICIEVQDHGIGIPIESQEHIFDPFYTTKPVGVGTGLGLGIVYRIVEQFGGALRFSSVPGDTVFMVRLPAERV